MGFDATVMEIVRKAVDAEGLEVVAAKMDGRRHIRVWIDKEPDGVQIADCSRANRAVHRAMNEGGLDAGAFHVEVLSPGLDRLLTRDKDFSRFAGQTVWVHLAKKRGDRRKFKGQLVGLREGRVVITEEVSKGELEFTNDEIDEVRLVPVVK